MPATSKLPPLLPSRSSSLGWRAFPSSQPWYSASPYRRLSLRSIVSHFPTRLLALLPRRAIIPLLIGLALYTLLLPLHIFGSKSVSPPWVGTGQGLGRDPYTDPPDRAGRDWEDSVDPGYRPLRPMPFPHSLRLSRLKPRTPNNNNNNHTYPTPSSAILPDHCLESWISTGELVCTYRDLPAEPLLDATWAWVNGSDPRWFEEAAEWAQRQGIMPQDRHYSEQDELQYSMRSVFNALRGHLRTLHLALHDFSFQPGDEHLVPAQALAAVEHDAAQWAQTQPGDMTDSDSDSISDFDTDAESTQRQHISRKVKNYLSANWRVAQTPSWLHFGHRNPLSEDYPRPPRTEYLPGSGEYPLVRYAVHSELFLSGRGEDVQFHQRDTIEGAYNETTQQVADPTLPSYNSMAIQNRMAYLPGLADEYIALHDDMFMLKQHSVADFHSYLFGNVIRLDTSWQNQVTPTLGVQDSSVGAARRRANYLLSQRFPARPRPNLKGTPTAMSRSLRIEAETMFGDALQSASTQRFRELSSDGDISSEDIDVLWLTTALRIERWREALLWTVVVANLGATEGGMWGTFARQELALIFGVTHEDPLDIAFDVDRGDRWTLGKLRIDSTFDQAKWQPPAQTKFTWSSLDGHLPPLTRKDEEHTVNFCMFSLSECFGSFWTHGANVTADAMMKRLAFEKPQCGDCFMMGLVTLSGPLGLSWFLPPPDDAFTPSHPTNSSARSNNDDGLLPPHLPLTPTWQEADYSLESVMATTAVHGEAVNLRQHTLRLLSRYLYVIGDSVTAAVDLTTSQDVNNILIKIDKRPDLAMVTLNDNIDLDHLAPVRKRLMHWFRSKWPEPAIWERGWSADLVEGARDDELEEEGEL